MIERILLAELQRRGVEVEHEVVRGGGHAVVLTWGAQRRLVVVRASYGAALRDAAGAYASDVGAPSSASAPRTLRSGN